MSTLEEIRSGLERAWDNVADGWRDLTERAGQALTRFTPKHPTQALESAEDQTARAGARWGLLAAEVRDVGDALEVRLEAPGMEAGDFALEVQGSSLVVRGEKRVEREEKRGHYHLMERAYGTFQRAIRLPVDVDDAKAVARYDKGVLEVLSLIHI